jgi:hypothetical protein
MRLMPIGGHLFLGPEDVHPVEHAANLLSKRASKGRRYSVRNEPNLICERAAKHIRGREPLEKHCFEDTQPTVSVRVDCHFAVTERNRLAGLIPVKHPKRPSKVVAWFVPAGTKLLGSRVHMPVIWM